MVVSERRGATVVRLWCATHPRASRIEVTEELAEFVIPSMWGRRSRMSVPLSTVSIFNLKADNPRPSWPSWGARLGSWDEQPDLFGTDLRFGLLESLGARIVFYATLGEYSRANLVLLFAETQRIPRIGWWHFGGITTATGFTRKEANSAEGCWINGAAVQARRPHDATSALVGAGLNEVRDLAAWLREQGFAVGRPEHG
jgi:hypothetical protein